MRRKHAEVTDRVEIERIMALTTIGRLATIGADGYPYVTPVNFVFHEGNLYFHCAPKGEKLDNLLRDGRVCFEVDIPLAYIGRDFDPEGSTCSLHQFFHCVIIRGTASVVTDDVLKTAALNALVEKHEPSADIPPVSKEMQGYRRCTVVEVKPSSITAKSDVGRNMPDNKRRAIARLLKKRSGSADLEAVRAMGFDPGRTDLSAG
jgi:hypothetical protein